MYDLVDAIVFNKLSLIASRTLRLLLFLILTLMALILTAFASAIAQDVFDKDGKRLGETKQDKGTYEVFDQKGNRIGTGRVAPDGSIRVYDPKTFRPLYEIKKGRGK